MAHSAALARTRQCISRENVNALWLFHGHGAPFCAKHRDARRLQRRKINMTISLAFLSPDLVKAAIEGRLPHGKEVVRLAESADCGLRCGQWAFEGGEKSANTSPEAMSRSGPIRGSLKKTGSGPPIERSTHHRR
jgi:hypothetical protein